MTTSLGERKSALPPDLRATDIPAMVRERMAELHAPKPFVPGQTPIPLNVPTYGPEEVLEALDSLMSTWVTMGMKVRAFEEMWAEYMGARNAIMVNSGSNANLLALSALKAQGKLQEGDEIITPAVTWATTVFPIAQVGCIPVLADVEWDSYNISPEAIEWALTPKTRAIMPVHLLGNPCDMGSILAIARNHDLLLIEDCCEAHGAQWDAFPVGIWGDVATFSFFFSHHISTIEGGMVVCSSRKTAEICRSMRAHGWIRDLADRDDIAAQHPAIDPRFLFLYPGFNFRPTELQGAFGIHQLPRLEGLVAHRRENALYWNRELEPYSNWLGLPVERPGTRHSYFAYPVAVKPGAPFTAKDLQRHLEHCGVETRQIESGNMALQPAMKMLNYRAGPLPNAQYVHDNGFFWGVHQGIGPNEREAVAGYFHDFMKRLPVRCV